MPREQELLIEELKADYIGIFEEFLQGVQFMIFDLWLLIVLFHSTGAKCKP